MYGIKTCGIKSYLKVFEEKLGYKMKLNNGKLTIKAEWNPLSEEWSLTMRYIQ